MALLEYEANQGLALNAGQVALVREMATSGARVQLALAPAGTGKTTAMAALATAWRNSGGTVIGLAPTAGAAEVLAEDLGAPTDTIAKLVQLTDSRGGPPAPADDPARKWFDTIGSDTLIIVDEAGMASTLTSTPSSGTRLARGASMRLIGDDQQLASVSAGGVLRDLAEDHDTVTLSTVVRFTHPETGPAEAAASLAIRAGDPAGIGFYIDHHRVHVGADAAAADMAYQAWAADRAAGRDSILLAPTNDLVAQLNERARLDRLTTAPPATPLAATVTLADGLTASAGDWIATRKNARWLRTTSMARWVKNGHRWIIRAVHDDGSITVVPLRGPATPVRLPARYVTTYTTLGYASTINAAQGMTAGGRDTEGTCHIVGSDRLTRQQLYVAATRGRTENHLYFSTAEADPHRILTPKATHPPTAVDILTAILAPRRRPTLRPQRRRRRHRPLQPAAPRRRHVLRRADAAAEQHAGPAVMARIDTAAARLGHASPTPKPGPCCAATWPCWPSKDTTPSTPSTTRPAPHSVTPTTPPPSSTGACHPHRRQAADRGPLHWLPAIPDVLDTDPPWGPTCAAAPNSSATSPTRSATPPAPGTPPPPPPGRGPCSTRPALMAEIAVFRAAHHVEPADTRITGPEQHANRSAIVQQAIHSRLDAALTRAGADTARWRQLADTSTPTSPTTRTGRGWPPTSTTPPAPAPTSPPCCTRPPPSTARCPLKCPPPPCGGA